MKQISAKPALLAATVLTLSCTECCGGAAAQARLSRPANPAITVSATPRRMHGAAGVAVGPFKTPKRSSMATKASRRHPPATKPKQEARVGRRHETHRKNHPRPASREALSKRQSAMFGLASFYWEDQETASGERFDRSKLSAAHRSLPFGTRLRVTNVSNGKRVTVRINDRGPFVHGRVIDLTSGAAEALGMIDAGVVKVTLDIVR